MSYKRSRKAEAPEDPSPASDMIRLENELAKFLLSFNFKVDENGENFSRSAFEYLNCGFCAFPFRVSRPTEQRQIDVVALPPPHFLPEHTASFESSNVAGTVTERGSLIRNSNTSNFTTS